MAVQITLNLSDTEQAYIAPMILARVEGMRRHPKVLEMLTAKSFDSVDDLTPKQKLHLYLKMKLWADAQMYKREVDHEASELSVAVIADAIDISTGI